MADLEPRPIDYFPVFGVCMYMERNRHHEGTPEYKKRVDNLRNIAQHVAAITGGLLGVAAVNYLDALRVVF